VATTEREDLDQEKTEERDLTVAQTEKEEGETVDLHLPRDM